jgi:hypothetical protein
MYGSKKSDSGVKKSCHHNEKDPWAITVYETAKNDLPQTIGMEAGIVPKFPSMQLLVGKSGSGKSILLVSMVKDPKIMGNFFDEIYFISPTAKADDLVEHLKLKPENVWDDLTKAVKDLETLMDNQAYEIEQKGIEECGKTCKVLVICDDCVGNKAMMKSDILTKMAIHGRHNLISSIICTQSYTKVPRVIRLQAQGLALFPSSQDEVKLLCSDYCPPHCNKKQFGRMIDFATDVPFSFMFVQNHCKDIKDRFRKRLGEIINIESFQ